MKKLLLFTTILVVAVLVASGCAMGQKDADTSDFIGADRAKEIALTKAGVSVDNVMFDRVELDRDNGIWCYEVEFRQGYTEYDAKIKAIDGTVLGWEVDKD